MLFLDVAGFSNSFGSLLVCRLLAGMTGAPVLAIGAGTNADLFQPSDRAFAPCIFIMVPFLGPAVVTMVRPIAMIFNKPIVLLFGLDNTFTFSVLFAIFAASPYAYAKEYLFNTWQTGLTFISIGLGVRIAAATAINFDRQF
ncbi:hypothetical protein AC578_1077 [Pseudocercospora eumusae]|uniref:Major facilitator superfamily (MFS) profile domain-containing protein n=1 Tax=Pseudocercospora eumusae TaxID=321146 RepID=A0A139HTT0_9PEZI|nr:hypothetical protein AC578_1077 [Pseudocercospora eumusae]